MKLSNLLGSIQQAAVIALILQNSASAAEEALSDKAQWLKENLAALDGSQVASYAQTVPLGLSGNKSPTLASLKSLPPKLDTSHSDMTGQPVLLPFHKLPTRKEYEAALLARKAKLAEEASQSSQSFQTGQTPNKLMGEISAFLNSDANGGTTNSNPYISSATARAHLRTRPSAVQPKLAMYAAADRNTPSLSNQSPALPTIAEVNGEQANPQAMTQSSVPAQVGFPLMQKAERYLFDQPPASPEDRAMIDHYASMEIGDGADDADNGSAASAGPPPFPLNLLPQASLKQLVHGIAQVQRPQRHGPGASFGGWRHPGSAPMLMAQPAAPAAGFIPVARALPPAGFHSYMQEFPNHYGNLPPYRLANYSYLSSPPSSYYTHRAVVHRPMPANYNVCRHAGPAYRNSYPVMQAPSARERTSQNGVTVAAYPPYASQVRMY
jgi:hypothetical protein